MLDDFAKLKERIEEFGNHHRKYLHLISTQQDLLVERLEESGAIDEVHLWSAAPDLLGEMDLVCEMGRDQKEKLDFLGCYFAFQILNLNVRAIDVLRLNLSVRSNRLRVYRDFMLQIGTDLRRLTSSYMERLLRLFLPPDQRPDFVICSVGTRADQDDLDLGIVDDGSARRATFNRAIGQLQREMLRRAIPLHLYISEHVGEQSFSASIEEFTRLLDREIQDFIIITEMLGAQPILGSRQLFARFAREVTNRYFYQPDQDNRFHEGYLRGMMGEVRSLQLRNLSKDRINPKRDALRIIKGIICAQKTVHGIKAVNAWDILHELQALDAEHLEEYEELEDALSFVEVFRFLYQLVEVQEEEILLQEAGSRAQLEAVAELMGYQGVGVVRGYDHLLIHYHEHVEAVRTASAALLARLQKHLEKISVFSRFLRGSAEEEVTWRRQKNLATEFVIALRFFRGTRFWDDVLGPIEENVELLKEFVDDFMSLPEEERKIGVQRYAKWGEATVLAILRLLAQLYRQRRTVGSPELFHELSAAFIDRLGRREDAIRRLSAVFEHFPMLINDLLLGLREEEARKFGKILEGEVWSEEVEARRKNLLYFCQIHCSSSHYFKRFFQRIVERYSEYIPYLSRTDRLRMISKGIFALIESCPTFEEKKEELGSYYDLEFLRIGLECIEGAPSEQTNAEFTEFVDNYLRALFDVCRQEVGQQAEKRIRTRDLLALYAAGGHGRKLAFDDDYDLIILLNSDDREIRRHCVKIISRLNREIVRRGTMPQYRFAEHFGDYVTTFSELGSLFEFPDDQTFIEMSQLMGARKIVGSKKFETELEERIVRPLILDRKEDFIRQVAGEIRSRHAAVEQGIISRLEVKETRGGLRDIELLLLILMAKSDLSQPVTQELHEPFIELYPQRKADLDRIFAAFGHLKRRRDIYRLTVAAEDEILAEETGYMAKVLGYCDDPDCEWGREALIEDFKATTSEVGEIVDSFLTEMGL